MKPTYDSFKISNPSSIFRRQMHPDGYFAGVIHTKYGIVDVHSEKGYTGIDFIHKGRLWREQHKRGFTSRGLVMKANWFAKRITFSGKP